MARKSIPHSLRRTKAFFVATFAGASALHRKDGTPVTVADALDDALRRIDTDQADDPRLQADLLSDLGEIRLGQGDLQGAKGVFERALVVHEKLLADDDPVLATTLENLASANSFLGDNESALPLAQRALAIREQHPGQTDALVKSRLGLVTIETNLGQYQRAFDQLEPVIAFGRRDPQRRSALLSDALLNSAYVAYQLDDLDLAKRQASEALQLFEASAGRNSITTATPLRLLARIAADQRDGAAERSLRERALQVARVNYPQGHPDVVAGLVEVGSLDLQTGEVTRGDALLAEAIRMGESLRIENDQYVRAFVKLAQSQVRQDRLPTARQTVDAGLQRCEGEALRDEGALCASLRAVEIRIRLAQGVAPGSLLEESRQIVDRMQRLLADPVAAGGASEFDLPIGQLALADTLSALGRHAEAAETLRPAVEQRRKIFGGIEADADGLRWRLAAGAGTGARRHRAVARRGRAAAAAGDRGARRRQRPPRAGGGRDRAGQGAP